MQYSLRSQHQPVVLSHQYSQPLRSSHQLSSVITFWSDSVSYINLIFKSSAGMSVINYIYLAALAYILFLLIKPIWLRLINTISLIYYTCADFLIESSIIKIKIWMRYKVLYTYIWTSHQRDYTYILGDLTWISVY